MRAHILASPPKAQRGVVLLVALIMLVIMSLLGISGIRTIALEEKMSGYAYDRSLAFQAAEAALRAGELDADDRAPGSQPATADGVCNGSTLLNSATDGYIKSVDRDCNADWMANSQLSSLWASKSKKLDTSANNLGTLVGVAPSYIIEYMGDGAPCYPGLTALKTHEMCSSSIQDCTCHHYRITAVSTPGDGRATVMLQSIYFTR